MHIFVVLLRREFKTASNGVQKMYKLHLKETKILRSRKRFHLEKFCQSSETSLQKHSEFFFKHFFGYIFFLYISFRCIVWKIFSQIDYGRIRQFVYRCTRETFRLFRDILFAEYHREFRWSSSKQILSATVNHKSCRTFYIARLSSLEQFFLPNSTPFRKHVEVATFWKLLPSAIDQRCFLVRFKKQRAFNKICSFGKKKEKTRKEVKGKGWHVFARNRWFKNSRTKCAIVLTV